MSDDRTICVICAWRATCNKKFSMDGSTTTRCPEFTKDVTLKGGDETREEGSQPSASKPDSKT